MVTPLLLPWIPVRPFSLKGGLSGIAVLLLLMPVAGKLAAPCPASTRTAWALISLAAASWFGMAFTGASTFVSPSGVRREMLRAIPLQFLALVSGLVFWLVSLWCAR